MQFDTELTANKTERRKNFSKVGWALTAMMLLTQVMAIVFAIVCSAFFPAFVSSNWYIWLLSQVPMYLFGFPALLLILKSVPITEPEERHTYTLKEMIPLFLINFAGLYLFNLVSVAINAGIGFLKGSPVSSPLEFTGTVPLQTLIFGVLIGPILEELVFRKILMGKVLQYGEGIAIFVSAFCFSLFHGNLSQMIYAFALGLLYAFITVKSGTILYSAALHMITNAMGMLVPILIENDGSTVLQAGFGLLILFLVIAGGVMFFRHRKEFRIVRKEGEAAIGQNIKAFLLNPGMIVYMLLCLSMVLFSALM